MHNKNIFLPVFLLVISIFAFSSTGHAQSIKQQMAARIPVINTMKNSGIVGENNQGFLQYLGAKKPHQDVVAAENRDRKTVYVEIAKKEGASAALVGQRRAKMLADRGPRGQWYQAPNGKWYKK